MKKAFLVLIVLLSTAVLADQSYVAAAITFNSMGDNTVIAATANKAIRVYGMYFTTDNATTITVKDGASNSLTGAMTFTQGGAAFWPTQPQYPWFITTRGNALVLNSSSAVQVSGQVYYVVTQN